jgi:dihydropyrimidinase
VGDYDLVIRGGTVITAAETGHCDLGVRDGRIVALGEDLGRGREEIDARGLLVLPGGIDSHCHMDQPLYGGARTADDFLSGTTSAACGGTTTVMPFAYQEKGGSLREVVEAYRVKARDKAVIDYAIHLVVSDPSPQVLGQELPALIGDGYSSFKIYLTYDSLRLDDRQVLEVLALARREGAMVMIHAENHEAIGWLTAGLELAGRTAPRHLAGSRPMAVEREATHRAMFLAELAEVPVLIVHVSGAEAVEQIRWARARGQEVYAETCPQYLFLTEEDLGRPGFEGAKYMCCPPPRDAANQEIIWQGLAGGVFQVFSSDHAPYRFEGDDGKKVHGTEASFSRIPPGVPGLETRLPLLFSEGVGKGRISLQDFVALTATNAARIYGLWPRKGTLAVGADADIALWDPAREVTISNGLLHHAVDYTPYEGMTVTGWPVMTLSRGELVCRDGEFLGAPGRGRFLACDKPLPARPS